VKKHSLHVGATEFLRAEVDPDTTPSTFTLPARTLRDWLDHFSVALGPGGGGPSGPIRGESQLGWSFGKNEVRVKSWEGGAKELSTEIRVDKGEFDEYWVEEDKVELALPVKEFRVGQDSS
jgi:cell cycle checkpoint control protein RAD9A